MLLLLFSESNRSSRSDGVIFDSSLQISSRTQEPCSAFEGFDEVSSFYNFTSTRRAGVSLLIPRNHFRKA